MVCVQIKAGMIIYREQRNPTGIRNKLLFMLKPHSFIYEDSVGSGGKVFSRMIGYKAKDPTKLTLL
jgi:hypothetical protein